MKLLITGKKSYIGTKVANYIQEKEPEWAIAQLDVRTDDWKEHSLSFYDVVYHVAGLAHRKITPENEPIYYKVNRDLSVEIANRARESGVRHFIFMSSMSVYNDNLSCVSCNTPTKPCNAYGRSKLQAEQEIFKLASKDFIVSIIRPPMIYGKGCKGNYNALRKIALKFPVFPKVNNNRSMLYIDNLSEFIRQLINCPTEGIFYPQNVDLVNTSDWVELIAEEHGKEVYMSELLGWCAKIGMHIPCIKKYCIKAFGDCYYDQRMSQYPNMDYQIVDFKESIKKTEC